MFYAHNEMGMVVNNIYPGSWYGCVSHNGCNDWRFHCLE